MIQILRIKALWPVNAGFAAVKAGRVNAASVDAKWLKAVFRNRDTAFRLHKNGDSLCGAVYRAVTLSSLMPGELGKARSPCMHTLTTARWVMKPVLWSFPIILCLATGSLALAQDQVRVNPTDPQPTCNMCPGTHIPAGELEGYTKKALAEKLLDQQVRDIDIGKAHIGIGMVHRGKLDRPAPDSVAEHDQISEVYHVLSGAATLVLGPDIVNRQRRPATMRTVVDSPAPEQRFRGATAPIHSTQTGTWNQQRQIVVLTAPSAR